MLKRSFDFLTTLVGIIVLCPLLLLCALWIKFDSKGPVFFRQARVGREGKIFYIHKFRTMCVDAEKAGRLTVGNDARITQSGHFLRKYKIDELPQLLDVLLGQMSLVGPRPEVPEFMNLYPHPQRIKILSVRPGITDRAAIEMVDENEILGRYEDARQAYIDVIMPIKAKFYLEYVENISFFEDINIIFATIKKILSR